MIAQDEALHPVRVRISGCGPTSLVRPRLRSPAGFTGWSRSKARRTRGRVPTLTIE